MNVGKYTIGKYRAIIKKIYEDGSFDYETYFTSSSDLRASVSTLRRCVNTIIGLATDNPRLLVDYSVIYGLDNVIAELGGAVK